MPVGSKGPTNSHVYQVCVTQVVDLGCRALSSASPTAGPPQNQQLSEYFHPAGGCPSSGLDAPRCVSGGTPEHRAAEGTTGIPVYATER